MYIIIAALIVIALLIYIGASFYLKKHRSGDDLSKENWADEKSYDMIHTAAQKADEIVSSAELEGIEIASKAKLGAKFFQSKYDEKLENALEEARKEFSTELQKTHQNYQVLLDNLQKESVKQQQELEELMKTKINETLLKFEQNLSSYLTNAETKSFDAINLELKSARQLIDTYKSQQLALIDENIVAVLERTLSLVTRNKLSLKEQLDLVYEALEKAKVEKFFA